MKSARIHPVPDPFVPEFGPRGELRQTIGASGRAHLDRWLPFLVLHRSDDPESSIARRVAVNSPAYLIWSPEEDAEAAEALRAIAAALRDRLGPILLIDVEDALWQAQPKDAPALAALRRPDRRRRRRNAPCARSTRSMRRAARSRSTFAAPPSMPPRSLSRASLPARPAAAKPAQTG